MVLCLSSLRLRCSLLFLVLEYLAVQAAGQHIVLVKEPSSLTIPVNENGTFSCKAQCDHLCLAFWLINGSDFQPDHNQRMHLEHQGNVTIGYTLFLTVNASLLMNNTRMECRYEAAGNRIQVVHTTNTAILFVMSEPPISSNPLFIRNATHFTLLWSPPFLWPGQRIEYFNVSVTDNSNRSTAAEYYSVNSSSSYYEISLMSFSILIVHPLNMLSCGNIMFSISAIKSTNYEVLQQTFSVSDWTWTLPSSGFTPLVINTSVLFKADATPALVEVYVQLPIDGSNCDYNKLNTSLVFENREGDLLTEFAVASLADSGVIKENIVFKFNGNQMYSLRVTIGHEAYSQKVTTNNYYFSASLLENVSRCQTCTTSEVTTADTTSVLPYKGLLGIFIVMSALLIFILVVLISCLCIRRKKVRKEFMFNESKNRVCNAMVHNPIYDGDGPVYESVQNHPWNNSAATDINMQLSKATSSLPPMYDNLQQATGSDNCKSAPQYDLALSVDRYVESQPMHLCGSSFVHTSTNNQGVCSSSSSINASRRVRVSVPSSRNMGRKKNGEERNKLHLTLSLGGGNGDSNPTGAGEVFGKSFPKSHTTTMDETYTVMSPAGTLCHHAALKAEAQNGEQSLRGDAVKHVD